MEKIYFIYNKLFLYTGKIIRKILSIAKVFERICIFRNLIVIRLLMFSKGAGFCKKFFSIHTQKSFSRTQKTLKTLLQQKTPTMHESFLGKGTGNKNY